MTEPEGAPELPSGRRVALVHDWLTGMRGGEKVLEEIAGLFPGAPIYTLFHFPGTVSAALESHPVHTSYLQGWPGVRGNYRRLLPFFPPAVEDFDLTAARLVVSSSHCVAKGVVPGPGAFHACYCHSPMRYAWDQEHAYFPRRRGLAARVRGTLLSRLRSWDVASAARVDLFLANSRFVASRIRRYYRREAEVLHPPVDTERFTPGDAGGERDGGVRPGGYCLTVAALAPYKRVEVAIAACEALGIELRVVGGGPEKARLERRVGPRTRLLGRVSDEELLALYRGADFLLQPGIEDFGIAPVEALACGTPVVALGEGGVLDIVDDGVHGVLYRPGPDAENDEEGRVSGLAAAIDKARQIRFNGLNLRSRAAQFSRSRFRERFLELVRSGLARHGTPSPRRLPDPSTARGTHTP